MTAVQLATAVKAHPDRAWARLRPDVLIAFGASFAVALRLPLPVPAGLPIALLLLPVSLGCAIRYVGARLLITLCAICALSGYLLAQRAEAHGRSVSPHLLHSDTIIVLMFALGTVTLLWARDMAGTTTAAAGYGLGALASLATEGVNPANPWKFSFSTPATLLVLAVPWVTKTIWRQAIVLSLVAGVSILNDARSATATMLVAAALVLTQVPHRRGRTATIMVMLRISLIGAGGYYLVRAATLDGVLGEAAQERSTAQIEQSGSLILGGRPESGAALALLHHHITGYGAGTLPTANDVLTAKSGMANLGYPPNNGYVERYLFGSGFEVHSVIGDLWLWFGLAGAALGLVMAGVSVIGISQAIGRHQATGLAAYLCVALLWNTPFSPVASAAVTLPLSLAVLLQPPRQSASARGRLRGASLRPGRRAAAHWPT